MEQTKIPSRWTVPATGKMRWVPERLLDLGPMKKSMPLQDALEAWLGRRLLCCKDPRLVVG